jgi:plastocyanin
MTGSIVRRGAIAAVCLVASLTGTSAAIAYEAGPVANGGTISGLVKFKGPAPLPEPIDVDKDRAACAKVPKTKQTLLVGADGGLRYAVVSLANIAKGKPFVVAVTPAVDESGCEYAPHVLVAPPGEVEFTNGDGVVHAIHAAGAKSPSMTVTAPQAGKAAKATFAQPDIVRLTCDVHGWMTGYVVVQEHPYYALTDERGAFKLADVPAGDYDLKVWHETLGETTQKVSVQPGADTKVTFELAPK